MEFDIEQTTQTALKGGVPDYSVSSYSPDVVGDQADTLYMNTRYFIQLGYFKGIPEVWRCINALSTWTCGKGYTTDNATQVILDNITGWGNETFGEIMINMQNSKKANGDSYAEIIRNEETGTLINIKVLGGDSIRHVVGKDGIIKRYEQITRIGKKVKVRRLEPQQVLHFCNDRIADEIHGTSLIDIVEWIIVAKQEAMADWKRISHRSTIRVLYIEADNIAKIAKVRSQYAEGIKNGEVLILPCKKGEAEFQDLSLPPIDAFIRWLQYLDSTFYQVIGVPKIIATSENFTESGGKVGFLTFEPTYTREQMLMEGDLWSQLAIKIKFNRPPSLGGDLNRDEAKDTGQMGLQPNDTQVEKGA